MKHLRKDYDRIIDPAGKIPADEPVFILRAMDQLASEAVRKWANDLREATQEDNPTAARVDAWADEMDWYREEHGGGKIPDVPEGALRPYPRTA